MFHGQPAFRSYHPDSNSQNPNRHLRQRDHLSRHHQQRIVTIFAATGLPRLHRRKSSPPDTSALQLNSFSANRQSQSHGCPESISEPSSLAERRSHLLPEHVVAPQSRGIVNSSFTSSVRRRRRSPRHHLFSPMNCNPRPARLDLRRARLKHEFAPPSTDDAAPSSPVTSDDDAGSASDDDLKNDAADGDTHAAGGVSSAHVPEHSDTNHGGAAHPASNVDAGGPLSPDVGHHRLTPGPPQFVVAAATAAAAANNNITTPAEPVTDTVPTDVVVHQAVSTTSSSSSLPRSSVSLVAASSCASSSPVVAVTSTGKRSIGTVGAGQVCLPCRVGRYILLDQIDERPLYKCINIDTEEELNCKIVSNEHRDMLSAHMRVDSHEHIGELAGVLVAERFTYLFFEPSYGDMHSYVRTRRRLREAEARHLFRQVVSAVQHCHDNGIVLHDLKLGRFVFKDPQRTQLKLDTLEDAVLLDEVHDDILDDKHGCPAYVSPEILMTDVGYSGRAADVWSLGIMLYAMLVGRYPFHDAEPSTLFNKIRGGHYTIPDTVSARARCLIRCLLSRAPHERPTAQDVLRHPWLRCAPHPLLPEGVRPTAASAAAAAAADKNDQVVPDTAAQQPVTTRRSGSRGVGAVFTSFHAGWE